jgi:hypothetical protein
MFIIIRIQKVILFLCFIKLVNCINVKTYTLESEQQDNNSVKTSKTIYIRNIKINDEIYDEYFKGNLIRALNDSGEFSEVETFTSYPKKNSIIIDIEFYNYSHELNPHPLYFPLGIITLTLYIWFGGPIIEYSSNMTYSIKFHESDLTLKKNIKKNFYFKDWENIYSALKLRKKMPTFRFNELKNSIKESI